MDCIIQLGTSLFLFAMVIKHERITQAYERKYTI
jgi:hypothetical protein